MFEIDWDKPFPAAYGIVTIPKDAVVYRGYSTAHPAVSERPAYYGSLHVAKSYGEPNGFAINAFTNTQPLKMLDIRCMKDLLRDMFNSNTKDISSLPVILSFGICSLYHQIRLLKHRYRDVPNTERYDSLKATYTESELFEQAGVRIAETLNDSETMGFLSSLFDGFVDGFISPALQSAYHTEKDGVMNPEMIVFNPLASGMRALSSIPHGLTKQTIDYIYAIEMGKRLNFRKDSYSYAAFVPSVSGDTTIPTIEEMNARWNTDAEFRRLFEKGQESGKLWANIAGFGIVPNPVPTLKINPWIKRNKTRRH